MVFDLDYVKIHQYTFAGRADMLMDSRHKVAESSNMSLEHQAEILTEHVMKLTRTVEALLYALDTTTRK